MTQVTTRPPTGMHGQDLAFRDSRNLPLLPAVISWVTALQRLGALPSLSLIEAGNLGTAFHSPTATALFQSHRGRVNAPGLSLRFLTDPESNPFGSELHSSLRFRNSGSLIARYPLPDPSVPMISIHPQTVAPRWASPPSGSKHPARFVIEKLTFAPRPIPVHSPPAAIV